MAKKIDELEALLAKLAEAGHDRPLYCEVGRYKPFAMPTIAAAKARGYRVEMVARCVYHIYPKPKAA